MTENKVLIMLQCKNIAVLFTVSLLYLYLQCHNCINSPQSFALNGSIPKRPFAVTAGILVKY